MSRCASAPSRLCVRKNRPNVFAREEREDRELAPGKIDAEAEAARGALAGDAEVGAI